MRKITFVLVAAMLLATGSSFANNNPIIKEKPTKNLSEQIGALLENNNLTEKEEGATAEVIFMLNDYNEIVVLSVDTDDNDSLEGFIKGKLNYQEVDSNQYETGKKYSVSVRVVV
jgi:hypothetical protein